MIIDVFRDKIIPRMNARRECPVNFTWGDSSYIREYLLTLKKGISTAPYRFPLIGLYAPIEESVRGGVTTASVNLILAVNTLASYTNEERLETSFKGVLRPLFEELKFALETDSAVDVPYTGLEYSYVENFSFGKRGALDVDGKEMDEKIDAIEIKNLYLKLKDLNCYANRL